MEMINKENAWKIIKGECTLPEAIKFFGKSQKYIDETMEVIKKTDIHNTMLYFATSQTFKRLSYEYLVKIGEIDNTVVFNSANINMEGDVGLRGGETVRYTKGVWEKMF